MSSEKKYIYKVYDNLGVFRGTLDVINQFRYAQEINSAGSIIDLKLARIDDLGIGEDIYLGWRIDVWLFYGDFVNWTDELGNDIQDELGNDIQFSNGAPNGRRKFIGIITRIIPSYGENTTSLSVASLGLELDNTMIEQDSVQVSVPEISTSSLGFGNNLGFPGNRTVLVQRFVPTISDTLISIDMAIFGTSFFTAPDILTINLYVGSEPADAIPANLLASSSRTVTDGFLNLSNQKYLFETNPPLSADVSYIFTITSQNGSNSGDDGEYPYQVIVSNPTAYGDGGLWAFIAGGLPSPPPVLIASTDIVFKIVVASGETTVSFFSEDPSNIVRGILDLSTERGGLVTYSDSSIKNTLTKSTYTFRVNTILEGLEKSIQLAPTDWYWYLEQGEGVIYFQERRNTPDIYITKGVEIQNLKLEWSIEEVINSVYFSGGDNGLGENIFIKRTDSDSINQWRRFVSKQSDNRVTNPTSLQILADGILDRAKEPRFKSTLTLNSAKIDIENIQLGTVIGFRNFGNFIEDLQLQVVSIDYNPDFITISVDTLLPKITKRLEDLKRNLDLLDTLNNPAQPSL